MTRSAATACSLEQQHVRAPRHSVERLVGPALFVPSEFPPALVAAMGPPFLRAVSTASRTSPPCCLSSSNISVAYSVCWPPGRGYAPATSSRLISTSWGIAYVAFFHNKATNPCLAAHRCRPAE